MSVTKIALPRILCPCDAYGASSSSPELEQDTTDGSIPTASSSSDASPSLDCEDASRPDIGKDSHSFATEI